MARHRSDVLTEAHRAGPGDVAVVVRNGEQVCPAVRAGGAHLLSGGHAVLRSESAVAAEARAICECLHVRFHT